MTAYFSTANLLAGSALTARLSACFDRTAVFETFTGIALISGLSVIGFGLRYLT